MNEELALTRRDTYCYKNGFFFTFLDIKYRIFCITNEFKTFTNETFR